MVRSLADRTFQPLAAHASAEATTSASSFPAGSSLTPTPGRQVRWAVVYAAKAVQRSCRTLVARFDIESYSDFSAKSSNFRGLVLRCIKADFCDQILIFQHFARSRRYAILCTAQISKFQQKVGQQFLQQIRIKILFSTLVF